VDTFPRNLQLFDRSVEEWWVHAQTLGSAHDPMMGIEPKAGTPFRAQAQQVAEGKSVHIYRRGKYAKFIEEVYKDWILPYIARQITKDQRYLDELSMDEMQEIADKMSVNESNKFVKEKILNGEIISREEVEAFKQQAKTEFMKSNKKFIEILEGDMKDIKLKVKVNVAGKQKDLAGRADSLSNIFRNVFSNPAILQYPPAAKVFNQILEASGFSSVDFTLPQLQQAPQIPQQAQQPNAVKIA